MGGGNVGVISNLSSRFDIFKFIKIKRRQKLRACARQRRRGPGLSACTNLTFCIHAYAAFLSGHLRQRHHRPGDKHFSYPAALNNGGFAIPRAIPLRVVLAFRQDGDVIHRPADIHSHAITVKPFAGRVDHQHKAIAHNLTIPRCHARDNGAFRLIVHHPQIDAPFRVKNASVRLVVSGRQGIRRNHAHAIKIRYPAPDRLIELAIQRKIKFAFICFGQC